MERAERRRREGRGDDETETEGRMWKKREIKGEYHGIWEWARGLDSGRCHWLTALSSL